MKLTYRDLRDVLVAAGLPAVGWQFPDETYETVSIQWALDNWAAWLAARPLELCVWKDAAGVRVRERPLWLAEAGDCDNLAIGTLAHAQVGNALAAQFVPVARGGLAYGVLFYTAGPARPENYQVAGGHAINWFLDHDHTVRFFEPGVGREVHLNPTERSTSWFGLAA